MTLRSVVPASLLPVASLAAFGPQDFLPPAPPWHGASESLIAAADDPWITPAEQRQLLDTPSYEETLAWLRRLATASPRIELREFGRTASGRPLWLVVASHSPSAVFNPAGPSRKPVLLAQAGIHSGEIDGKDAGLMLLRDIALRGKQHLLDGADLVFIPVLNVDGHERSSPWTRPNQRGPVHMGWRTTDQNLNLNRDYLKADAPEMRALLTLLRQLQPSLYLDLHVTDGIDYQYDVTFGYNGDHGSFAWSPQIAAWLAQHYRPALTRALQDAGHIPGPLVFALDDRNLAAGLSAGTANPRYSTGYGDICHVPTVLVENHSLKPYPQRVLGTYILLETSLRLVAEQREPLASAIAADQAARPATLALNWGEGGGERRVTDFLGIAYETYVSPASGTTEVRWTGQPKLYRDLPLIGDRPRLAVSRPAAYWVPPTKPEVIARLAAHGIRYETLASAHTVTAEFCRLVDPQPEAQPSEGRHQLTAGAQRTTRTADFPAGSIRVPTDQPLGDLAIALLEPESSDSLLAWGFFPEILQRTEYIEGYVIAPLAEHLLASDPALKAEFEQKLADDPAFAADPQARLGWFYAKTKFYDDRYLLYPIGIER